jgi:hypothetical protein
MCVGCYEQLVTGVELDYLKTDRRVRPQLTFPRFHAPFSLHNSKLEIS